ncbi:MAG: AAA family ATPase [Aigarchaeota archaeon]|nr:AAA family ATPase [Aigarchaeota archaeon]MCX8192800.1 AAA family ATPase [Nitrososphaeria archaeon]MDW7986044.1 AAA family ATPase [Nitrososphaerota archaeon]
MVNDYLFIKNIAEKLESNIHEIIVGMGEAIRSLLIGLLSEGHILIEGPPGTAKTYLGRVFANSLGLEYRRIQFTIDLMPSDITGSLIYNRATGTLEFRPGPIFANVVLADEINRASPRSQSALLECMQEKQVTIEGVAYPLPRPFLIIATQNPIELEGTYPLPEAELDRFLIRVFIDYLDASSELEILSKKQLHGEKIDVEKIASLEEILKAIDLTSKVYVDRSILEYIVKLGNATRKREDILLGVSPRGEVYLLYASKAAAAIDGKSYVTPDHIKSVVKLVFNHRIILKSRSVNPMTLRREILKILDEIVEEVEPPR